MSEVEIIYSTINKRRFIQSKMKKCKGDTHARYDVESYLYIVYSMVDPKTVS